MSRADRNRVKGLLTEAIRMLCKSSLSYKSELNIEGLLGITLDNNDVFLVNINESVVTEDHPDIKPAVVQSNSSKSTKRVLPNFASNNLPLATSTSSLPGERSDGDLPPAKRQRSSDESGQMKDDNNSDSTLVDLKLEPLENQKEAAELSSLSFDNIKMKCEVHENEQVDYPAMDSSRNMEGNDGYPTYPYSISDNEGENVGDENDVVVVSEEMGRRTNYQSDIKTNDSYTEDMLTQNLLTHDEYMTSYSEDQGAAAAPISNVTPTQRQRANNRGRGSTPRSRGRGSYSNKQTTPSSSDVKQICGGAMGGSNIAYTDTPQSNVHPGSMDPQRFNSFKQETVGYHQTSYPSTSAAHFTPPSARPTAQSTPPAASFSQSFNHPPQYNATSVSSSKMTNRRIRPVGAPRPSTKNIRTKQSTYGSTITKVTYQCAYCKTILSSSGALRNHVVIKHTKNSNLRCEVCDRVFVSSARLINHQRKCGQPGGNLDY